MTTGKTYQDYLAALYSGDWHQALSVGQSALVKGIDIRDLYLDVIQPAMYEIGYMWETQQVTAAQEHVATAISQRVMAQLFAHVLARPGLGRMLVSALGRTAVATCVPGESHELGLRMVADFFEIEGWNVYYLGADVPTDAIVRIVNEQQADLLAISVTMINNVLQARELIQAVRESPIGARVRVLVGGQAFNRMPDLHNSVGADFTAPDALKAVNWAMEIMA